MEILDLGIIIGISVTIVCLILMILSLVQMLRIRSKRKKLSFTIPKGKSQKKRWKKSMRKIKNAEIEKIKVTIVCLAGVLIIGSGTAYARYYQKTTINQEDIENIVNGYYLLSSIESELKHLGEEVDKNTTENIRTLSVSLASFSSQKGNDKSELDAQILLNKYYAQLGQLGININSQDLEIFGENSDILQSYLEDIQQLKQTQKKVIDYYKIEETSLNMKK